MTEVQHEKGVEPAFPSRRAFLHRFEQAVDGRGDGIGIHVISVSVSGIIFSILRNFRSGPREITERFYGSSGRG